MTRTDGSGGLIHSFCAMNSFSMSFWIVPPSADSGTPRRSAIAKYIARMMLAEQLTVIEVVMSASGMPSNSASMSARLLTETPSRPTSPSARAWSAS